MEVSGLSSLGSSTAALEDSAALGSASSPQAKRRAGRPKGFSPVLSEETKRKMSAAHRGKRHSDATREAMRRAHLGRKHDLGTRYKIHLSRVGRKHSPETIAKSVATRARNRAARLAAEGRQPEPAMRQMRSLPAPEADALLMEKAVAELVALRREVQHWMNRYEQQYGAKPVMEDAAQHAPHMYKKFVRYITLRDFVRSNFT
ncbi:hypothetical protein WJX72_007332 [[Myrmecia] bisecta]|uniref:Nuclease associated modular domain-containing protein n=1 Tax=[Myrmecia] bisecta TaxID=41462 RepID=A0AAW1PQH7_9CHLO